MSESHWNWTFADLEHWDERINQRSLEMGLHPFDVDFRVLNWEQLIDFQTYHMPYHYRHWSFGRDYDLARTAKRYEAGGLPYEMVVNTDPAVAVLWRDNNLVIQIMVIAHVYGHSDFFANNNLFRKLTRADLAEDACRSHAREIAEFNEDPSIPSERVEELLTAAHALFFHRPHTPDYVRETRAQQKERLIKRYKEDFEPDEWSHLKPKKELQVAPLELNRVPLEPDEDLLRFLAEYSPLEDWERRILEIVAAESDRLMPNVSTKIMNEGWATYWHDRILHSLREELPPGFAVEYARTMAGVLHVQPMGINPYWLGLNIWRDIYRRYETPDRTDPNERDLPGGQGDEMLFKIRQTDTDASFVAGYLTDRLISELDLLSVVYEGDHLDVEMYRITDVPDREGFERIRRKLTHCVSMNMFPVIRVADANIYSDRTLRLEHVHDGRDLRLFKPDAPLRAIRNLEDVKYGSVEPMLRHIQRIWRNPVCLRTRYDGVEAMVHCDRQGVVSADLKT